MKYSSKLFSVVRNARLVTTVFATLLLGQDLLKSTSAKDDQTLTPVASLLARIDKIRTDQGVAGTGLVLINNDQLLWSGGLGVTNWQSQQPMSDQAYVRIGSITKLFTGLAMLKAQSQQLIDLDQAIKHDPSNLLITNPWRETHPVTLAQLLEHTAGLTDMVKAEWDHNDPISLTQALAVAPHSRRLNWLPGQHSSYSNSGAGVAAFVFEHQTKLDFEQWMNERVFQPMSMDSATFAHDGLDNLATGYDRDGKTPIPYWHTLYRPFGGLNVRVDQMRQLIKLFLDWGMLDDQRVFSRGEIERAEKPATTLAARAGLDFGYGLGNYAYTNDGFVWHGHGGDADGYLSHFAYNRDSGMGYFIVINAFKGQVLRQMRDEIEQFATAQLSPRFEPGRPQPNGSFEQLVGRYQSATYRFPGQTTTTSLEVLVDDGRLILKRGQRRERLIPLSGNQFRRTYEPVATLAFVETDSQWVLQGPFGNYVKNSNIRN